MITCRNEHRTLTPATHVVTWREARKIVDRSHLCNVCTEYLREIGKERPLRKGLTETIRPFVQRK